MPTIEVCDDTVLIGAGAIAIAVAVPHGLVVPVIQSCEAKTIEEIAIARADIVERRRRRARDRGRTQPLPGDLGRAGVP